MQAYRIKSYSCCVDGPTAIISAADSLYRSNPPLQYGRLPTAYIFSFDTRVYFSVMFAIGALESVVQHGWYPSLHWNATLPQCFVEFFNSVGKAENWQFVLWNAIRFRFGSGCDSVQWIRHWGFGFNSNIKWAVVPHIKCENALRLLPFPKNAEYQKNEKPFHIEEWGLDLSFFRTNWK